MNGTKKWSLRRKLVRAGVQWADAADISDVVYPGKGSPARAPVMSSVEVASVVDSFLAGVMTVDQLLDMIWGKDRLPSTRQATVKRKDATANPGQGTHSYYWLPKRIDRKADNAQAAARAYRDGHRDDYEWRKTDEL